jgi:hypothetical protein
VTASSLYDVGERLESNPSNESDFKLLLAGAKSTPDTQVVAAQLITRFYTPLPKLKTQVVSAVVELMHSNDPRVCKGAILSVPKLIDVAKPEVADALFHALGDSDGTMVATVVSTVVQLLKSDDEFRQIFLRAVSSFPLTSLCFLAFFYTFLIFSLIPFAVFLLIFARAVERITGNILVVRSIDRGGGMEEFDSIARFIFEIVLIET